jgi:hypothetical protein
MATATKTQTQKPETPFKAPKWQWNYVPQGGVPTRTRCQSIVSAEECEAGAKLIATYREWEAISAANDIEGKTEKLNRSYRIHTMSGVEQENLRREITKCDNQKFVEAEAKLGELRKEAFAMAEPMFKRLIKSLDDELQSAAIESEQRLDRAGLPIRNGDSWMLRDDVIAKALWSCRNITEKTRIELLQYRDGIGSIQFFCTDEDGVPFTWTY